MCTRVVNIVGVVSRCSLSHSSSLFEPLLSAKAESKVTWCARSLGLFNASAESVVIRAVGMLTLSGHENGWITAGVT